MIVGAVCARAGSKGVPGKNMRPLAGRPLLEHSVEHAYACPLIDVVVLATDYSIAYGDVQIDRPEYLNTDDANKWDVWRHVLQAYEKQSGHRVEALVDLDVTRPLRDVADITGAIELFRTERDVDGIITMADARVNPYQDILEPNADGSLTTSKHTADGPVYCRQQVPPAYEYAGVAVLSRQYLLTASHLFAGVVRGYKVPADRAIDIDTEADWADVEARMGALVG